MLMFICIRAEVCAAVCTTANEPRQASVVTFSYLLTNRFHQQASSDEITIVHRIIQAFDCSCHIYTLKQM